MAADIPKNWQEGFSNEILWQSQGGNLHRMDSQAGKGQGIGTHSNDGKTATDDKHGTTMPDGSDMIHSADGGSELDIFNDITPAGSKAAYEKAWSAFLDYAKPNGKPGELDYARYFQHLKKDKGFKASSL